MWLKNDERFVNIGNYDLCNAIDNIDFLLTKINITIELYEILIKFRNDLMQELQNRGVVYG